MSYSKEVVSIVLEQFNKKRQKNKEMQVSRLFDAQEKIPSLRALDRELSATGLKIFEASFLGKEGLEERINIIKEENQALLKKRAELLESNGFASDYTDMKYECDICQDQGYVNGKMCSCLRNALVTKQLEMSGVGQLILNQSFNNFSLEFYPQEERENMTCILEDLKKYAANFKNECANMLFVGGTGLGKTHLSTALAKAIIEQGYNVIYETATNIFADFENDRFRDRYNGEEPISTKYLECDLLIIDDLGTEVVTNFSVSCLYNLLNTRLNKRLPTICSTNLSSADIRKLYNDRITSRIFGDFEIKLFKGTDIRKLK